MSRLRLMISSNAFWSSSGYGVQCGSLMPRLAELPEFGGEPGSLEGRKNIAQHAWYGLAGGMHSHQGFLVYPAGNDPYGNDVIGMHMKHFGANVLVSLIDVWVLQRVAAKIQPALFCPWLPIDHDPVPQRVLDCLEGAHLPLTYAKWGRDMLTQAGVKNHYIPHGIEPTVYRVNADREAALAFKRGLTGKEECFLCVMVAANKGFPDRKWFQGQLRAFQGLRKEHPDAMLYIHSEPTPVYGGLEFGALIHHLGLAGSVIFPDRYDNFMGMSPDHLADIYNAADVLLGASMSEGFGIPLIEAQACGTPVVTTNFSAMPELVRWGYAVDVADYVWTPMNAYQAWPDVKDMTAKLNRLYEQWEMAGRDWPMAKRVETQNAIHAEYDWDSIVRDQWAPLITRLAEEAPPLDGRFQSPGVSVGKGDDAQDFVDVVNEELAKDASKGKRDIAQELRDEAAAWEAGKPPKRRVAPLTPVRVNSDGLEVVP